MILDLLTKKKEHYGILKIYAKHRIKNIFNQDDLPFLLDELIVYRDQYRYQMTTEERETITKVIVLVENNLGKPHIRIAFIGD